MFNRLGLEVRRYRPLSTLHGARAHALRAGRIDTVLDVGANAGQYGLILRAEGYQGRIVSFEPLGDAFRELQGRAARDAAWEARRLALGDRDGSTEINRAANVQSSSLRAMRALHLEGAPESAYVGVETVEVRQLDSLASELELDGASIFLKLDVQGFEREVLRGGAATLRRVAAVECELSLQPLYEGQALFPELLGLLDGSGLHLVALEHTFSDPRTGRLLQLDGLFVRSSA